MVCFLTTAVLWSGYFRNWLVLRIPTSGRAIRMKGHTMTELSQFERSVLLDLGGVEEFILLYRESPFWMKWWLRGRARRKIDTLRQIYDAVPPRIADAIERIQHLVKIDDMYWAARPRPPCWRREKPIKTVFRFGFWTFRSTSLYRMN